MLISFSGTHGTGKTTLVYRLSAELKLKTTKNLTTISEVARQCPFPIATKYSIDNTPEAQLWIFSRQIQTELEAVKNHDIVVADRTAVDCVAYTASCGMHELAFAQLKLLRQYKGIYDKIFLVGTSEYEDVPDDGVRARSKYFQLLVQDNLLCAYAELRLPVERVTKHNFKEISKKALKAIRR